MNNTKISLNFIELTPKNFNILFFWKRMELNCNEEHTNCYTINSKEIENTDKAQRYAIAFDEENGFEKFETTQKFSISISKHFILIALRRHLQEKGITFYETNKDKYNRLYLTVNTHIEGTETIWLEPYFLKQTNSFGLLIDFRFFVNPIYKKNITGSVDKRILQLTGTLDSKGFANKAFYQFKYEKIKTFFHTIISTGKDISFLGSKLTLSDKLIEISSNSLNSKVYQFYNDSENVSPYFGLQKNPPFQKPDKNPNFLFIFKESDRGLAINLLNGLKGISSPNTFPGIEKLFGIPFNNDCIKGKKVNDYTYELFSQIVEEIKSERENGKNTIPLIVTNSKTTEIDNKLYYLIKHTFVKNDIACQIVTKDLINNTNALKYSLSNIGLQIFAKAGGKPWKVKPALNECLIIGIGSKNKEIFFKDENGNEKRKIEKYLTYSVLTDSSGLFKEIQVLSETDNEEDYHRTLVTKLNLIVSQAIKEGYKDIVFHIPFKISKANVWDILFKYIQNDINISVLIINSEHKYFGFDLSKNALVPYESSYITLSEFEYLVWFEGLQYNNAPFSKPIGSPIYINFWHSNKSNLFDKLEYRKNLLQDCINLSGANWRGFKAKQMPVSIFYCQKIADFLKNFENYNFEHIELRNLKPWFL